MRGNVRVQIVMGMGRIMGVLMRMDMGMRMDMAVRMGMHLIAVPMLMRMQVRMLVIMVVAVRVNMRPVVAMIVFLSGHFRRLPCKAAFDESLRKNSEISKKFLPRVQTQTRLV